MHSSTADVEANRLRSVSTLKEVHLEENPLSEDACRALENMSSTQMVVHVSPPSSSDSDNDDSTDEDKWSADNRFIQSFLRASSTKDRLSRVVIGFDGLWRRRSCRYRIVSPCDFEEVAAWERCQESTWLASNSEHDYSRALSLSVRCDIMSLSFRTQTETASHDYADSEYCSIHLKLTETGPVCVGI